MNQRFYAVKDVLVGSFMEPRAMVNDNVAKRALAMAAKDPNAFKENKKDIQLWYVFTLDTDSGLIVENTPQFVGNLMQYVEVDPDEYREDK